ncbi:hypothetical protein RUND412_002959 [Rhizina undulata]
MSGQHRKEPLDPRYWADSTITREHLFHYPSGIRKSRVICYDGLLQLVEAKEAKEKYQAATSKPTFATTLNTFPATLKKVSATLYRIPAALQQSGIGPVIPRTSLQHKATLRNPMPRHFGISPQVAWTYPSHSLWSKNKEGNGDGKKKDSLDQENEESEGSIQEFNGNTIKTL